MRFRADFRKPFLRKDRSLPEQRAVRPACRLCGLLRIVGFRQQVRQSIRCRGRLPGFRFLFRFRFVFHPLWTLFFRRLLDLRLRRLRIICRLFFASLGFGRLLRGFLCCVAFRRRSGQCLQCAVSLCNRVDDFYRLHFFYAIYDFSGCWIYRNAVL